ncbi:ferredoxin [Candidatus Sumerlaeota bacterium]|nr:ferredoxin [Candidatus Sumerlaeota bacterium]
MRDRRNKLSINVPGKYYVDCTCIAHACCQNIAPDNFRFNEKYCVYYVAKQPETEIEEKQMQIAVERCPVYAIGCDGDMPDAEFYDCDNLSPHAKPAASRDKTSKGVLKRVVDAVKGAAANCRHWIRSGVINRNDKD